ncbi:MAG: hypothetical protein IPM27_12165 [Nitrosomonadales bacterium]|nr:hypothetical protein [Nitrosomonadales bacterium]
MLEILTANGDISRPKLPFIDQLHLAHPVTLQKKAGLIDERHIASFEPSEKQSCSVVFTNGKALDGETVGFVIDKSGLYLYLPKSAESVIRYFIPAHAIKSYRIGESIGEMLIKENVVTRKDVETGLEKQEQLRSKRIGEYLTDEQIVSTGPAHRGGQATDRLQFEARRRADP